MAAAGGLALLISVMAPAATAAEAAVAALKAAMADRLAAMPDVARHKWNLDAAVEDRAQEQVVIGAAAGMGRDLGLPEAAVRQAIAAQIEAAKRVQSHLVEGWRAANAGRFDNVPDLASELRPRISGATRAILDSLPAAFPTLRGCDMARMLRIPPTALADVPAAWDIAADGVIAAAGGPDRSSCAP